MLLCLSASGQDGVRLVSYLSEISSRAYNLEYKLEKRFKKTLEDLQKQEARIKKKLKKIDSLKVKQVFDHADWSYRQLEQKLQSADQLQQYIPSLDTISTSLKFLEQNYQLLAMSPKARDQLKNALSRLKSMQGSFQRAEEIKSSLKERKQYLREQLARHDFAKEIKQLNKQVYYYSNQLNEYKELLRNHRKSSRKAIKLLSKAKLFNDFMKRNSMLASMFRLADDVNSTSDIAILAGLQTRTQISNFIQQQLAAGGAGVQKQFSQYIQDAQGLLNQLKNKVIQSGKGNSNAEIPEGFRANDQKTKTFLQRLELGTNIQSQKANSYLPATSDIGLSVGYKFNDKAVIGVGTSYKIAWAQNIRNIKISHQGLGFRTYVDWKIKRSFWMSGGYEMNYKSTLQDFPSPLGGGWEGAACQQSGLIGLSKVISLRSKLLKKSKLQLFWDFMSYRQIPKTQAVLFRIGYTLN